MSKTSDIKMISRRVNRAVSPVIATILVISIVLSSISMIFVWGVPYMEKTKLQTQQTDVSSQLDVISDTIKEMISNGPGTTRENRISMDSGELSLSKIGSRDVIYYSYDPNYNFTVSGLDDGDNRFTLNVTEGTITKAKAYWLSNKASYSELYYAGVAEEPSSTPTGYFYDYSRYNLSDTTNDRAYKNTSGTEALPNPSTFSIEYNSTEYANASYDDSNINMWYGNLSYQSGKYANLLYKIKVNENPQDVDKLEMRWKGLDTFRNGGHLGFYIWNISSGAWEHIGGEGTVLRFDGVDDYVDIHTSSGGMLDPDNLTVEAWIYINGSNANVQRIFQRSDNTWGLYASSDGKTISFYVNTSNDGGSLKTVSSNVHLDSPYHVVGVYDGSRLLLYVNGTEVGNITQTGAINNGGDYAYIGSDNGSSQFFNGNLGDIRVYNRALSSTEIEDNYNGEITTDNLVAWWDLGEGSGNALHDRINHIDGSIHDVQWLEFLGLGPIGDNPSQTEKEFISPVFGNISNYVNSDGYVYIGVVGGKGESFTAPSNCAAWYKDLDEAYCNWTDAYNEDNYTVEYSLDDGNWQTDNVYAANTTQSTPIFIGPDHKMVFRVRSTKSTLYSDWSQSSATYTTPKAPTNIGTTLSSSNVDINWTDQSSYETGFVVERSIDNSSFERIATLPAGSTSYTDANVERNHNYTYKVGSFVNLSSQNISLYNYSSNATIFVPPNSPPNTPSTPSGPTSGYTDTTYTFSTSTTDPDGDQVSYYWDWGDGTYTGWTSYTSSGSTVSASHSWSSTGTYYIKVKAKDTHGAQSSYSSTHSILISSSSSCFLSGTKVTMADGSYKNIENVNIGDKVLTYDQKTDSFVPGSVIKTFHHTPSMMTDYYLIINNNLKVTPNHPMWVNGKWIPAGDIKIGDKLLNQNGNNVLVTSIQKVYHKVPTYNLEVSNTHTYIANGIVVHNKISSCCFPAGTKVTMADGKFKNIENIVSGDKVLSYDVNNKTFVPTEVTITTSPVKTVYDINNGLISPTSDHPLFVKKPDGRMVWAAIDPELSRTAYGYRNPVKLEIGDELLAQNGTWIKIYSIEPRNNLIKTYTFSVNLYPHDYFANGILVSNSASPTAICKLACFVSGTKVTMADGSERPIEEIKKGSRVLSYNLTTHSYAESTVTAVYHYVGDVYSINNGILKLTDNHPLFVKKPDGRMVWAAIDPNGSSAYKLNDVKKLEIGDYLLLSNGSWSKILSIGPASNNVDVYTLVMSSPYTFFANGILARGIPVQGNTVPLSDTQEKMKTSHHHTLYEDYVELRDYYIETDYTPPKTVISSTSPDEVKTVGETTSTNITFYWYSTDQCPSDGLLYTWILEGSDQEWHAWCKDTSVTYTDLGPGNYTFKVRAMDMAFNVEDEETDMNTLHFNILPPENETVFDPPISSGSDSSRTVIFNRDISGFVLIDLYDGSARIGRIWLIDSGSLSYSIPSSYGTYGTSLEDGAVVWLYPSTGGFIWKDPVISCENNQYHISMIQMVPLSEITVGGNTGGAYVIKSTLTKSSILEYYTSAYNLRFQFFGDTGNIWLDYITKKYNAKEEDSHTVAKFGNINLAMAYYGVETSIGGFV